MPVGIRDLFRAARVISLHADYARTGPNLVGAELLAIAHHALVLVNTARAGLVDHDALAEFLDGHPNARVLSDVYPIEPIGPTTLAG